MIVSKDRFHAPINDNRDAMHVPVIFFSSLKQSRGKLVLYPLSRRWRPDLVKVLGTALYLSYYVSYLHKLAEIMNCFKLVYWGKYI